MKPHDIFIEKYKELESLLTCPVREYEESLEENESQKIRLCRFLRNYIQHNADYEKIVSIAPGLQSFLEDFVDKLHRQKGIIKDHMTSATKYGFVYESDTIVQAAALMSKKGRTTNIVLNHNGEYVGIISKEIISDYLGVSTITKNTKVAKIKNFLISEPVVYFDQTTVMDLVNSSLEKNNAIVLVINNSKKIVGAYNTEKTIDKL